MHSVNRKNKLIFFLLLIVIAGCRNSNPGEDVVARVGGSSLGIAEMAEMMAWEGVGRDNASEFVDRWVSRELLYQEAKRLGLDRSEELERELALVRKEYAIQKFLELEYDARIDVSEEEISAYYERNKPLFEVVEDEVRLLHILTPSREDANRARQSIISGRAFRDVAGEMSTGEFKSRGGDLGIVRRGDLIDELSSQAFRMAEGAISRVISSQYGFHIIQVEKKYGAGSTKPLKDVRDEIRQRIYVTKQRTVYNDLIYELRDRLEPYIAAPKDSIWSE